MATDNNNWKNPKNEKTITGKPVSIEINTEKGEKVTVNGNLWQLTNTEKGEKVTVNGNLWQRENKTIAYMSVKDAELIVENGIQKEKHDNINHPKHYTSDPSGIECIQITRHRNNDIGNAIKYLWRAGLKDDPSMDITDKTIEDLEKAIFYIKDEIQRLKDLRTKK